MAKPPNPNQTEFQRKRMEAMRRWRAANPERATAAARSLYERNKDHFLSNNREWRAKNKESDHLIQRRGHLRRAYGLTANQYDAMVLAQGGLCAICAHPPSVGRYLDVDHDHATGEIRGLLCRHCNSALGLYDESPELLRRAADYIERHALRKATSS